MEVQKSELNNEFYTVDDGRDDVIITVDGKEFIRINQDGYQSLGMSIEQAKEFAMLLIKQYFSKNDAAQ